MTKQNSDELISQIQRYLDENATEKNHKYWYGFDLDNENKESIIEFCLKNYLHYDLRKCNQCSSPKWDLTIYF